jgi:hypothetical protein
VPTFGASAKVESSSAESQAFDTTCSARLDCWVDTIPLGPHRFLADFRLRQLSLRDHCTGVSLSITIGTNHAYVSCRLAVSEARLALADPYNVAVRIANVAARLAILFLWLCDELGSSTAP